MVAFIDEHKERFGVEPICAKLLIAPSAYYDRCSRKQDPSKCRARSRNEGMLKVGIQRVWDENFQVYGARKVWHQLNREDIEVARCTVERLMKEMGLCGAVRGSLVIQQQLPTMRLHRPLTPGQPELPRCSAECPVGV